MPEWAQYYKEIPDAVEQNSDLRASILEHIESKPMFGKAVEGGDREDQLREILVDFFNGEFGFQGAYDRVAVNLPATESIHYPDNRTFSKDWKERLIRTQGNRFYNQGALHLLADRGETVCYVPTSPDQVSDSACTKHLADREAEVETLLERLEERYDRENYETPPTVPGHPNCTHTIVPVDQ